MSAELITGHHTDLQSVLKGLLKEKKMSGSALARELALPSPTVNRLLSGQVTDPRTSTLLAIANYFNIAVEQLLGYAPLPEHFMNADTSEQLKTSVAIPLYSDATDPNNLLNPDDANDWFHWHTNNTKLGKHACAIKISRNNLEPVFARDTILIVDSTLIAQDGDYIVVNEDENDHFSIRHYIADSKEFYLCPLRPGFKTISYDKEKHKIYGVVTEAHHSWKVK